MTSFSPLLLQIADSAFPTGAFAYSSGLEALARAGHFPTTEKLEAYLDIYSRQAESFDLAFVLAAHETKGAEVSFVDLCRTWDAYYWNQNIRKASLRQGRTFLDLLDDLFPNPEFKRLRQRSESEKWPLHFALALGHSLALMEVSKIQTCWIYLHAQIRDQIAAIVRLGLLGSKSAQAMQARVMDAASQRIGEGSNLSTIETAWRTAPLIEVGQGAHGFLYSRLFQN